MKTKTTIKLDSALLREAKVLAAEDGMSASRWLGLCLKDIVNRRKAYTRARKRASVRLQTGMDLGWICPRREELHER